MQFPRWLVTVAVVSWATFGRAEDARGIVTGSAPVVPGTRDDPMLAPLAPPSHVLSNWQEALEMLRARSTDLRIARDEMLRAEAGWRASLGALLPTLTANASTGADLIRGRVTCGANCSTLLPSPAVSVGAGVGLTQPLFAPRAWNAVGTSEVTRANTALAVSEQERQLSISLAGAIVAVVTGERVGELNRIGLRAALERLALARRRAELGAANLLDIVRAEQDAAGSKTAIVSGDESLRQAREALGLALGTAEAWGVRPDIELEGLESSARATCEPVAGLESRTDIAAARGSVAIAERNIADARLKYAPTLNLFSNWNASSLPQYNGLHQTWTIAGVLTIPLFEGGIRYAEARDARAQHDETMQRLEGARRAAAVQVTQARRAVDVAEEGRRVAEQARDLAKETERLARVAFQAGTGTSLDLVESGRRLREAEVELVLREFQLVQARIFAILALARCHW